MDELLYDIRELFLDDRIYGILLFVIPLVIFIIYVIVNNRRCAAVRQMARSLQEREPRFARSKLFEFRHTTLSGKLSFMLISKEGLVAIKTPERQGALILDARNITNREDIISEGFTKGIHRITELGILFDVDHIDSIYGIDGTYSADGVDEFEDSFIDFTVYSQRLHLAMRANSRKHVAITVKLVCLIATLDEVREDPKTRRGRSRKYGNVRVKLPKDWI